MLTLAHQLDRLPIRTRGSSVSFYLSKCCAQSLHYLIHRPDHRHPLFGHRLRHREWSSSSFGTGHATAFGCSRTRVGCSGKQEKLLWYLSDRDPLTSRTGLVLARYNALSRALWLIEIL